MSKTKGKIGSIVWPILFIISIVLIIVFLIVGLSRCSISKSGTDPKIKDSASDKSTISTLKVSDDITAYFKLVVIEKFNEDNKLSVITVSASEPVDVKEAGIVDVGFLNKTKTLKYNGKGNFYIDLSKVGKDSIVIDKKSKTVLIKIPHPLLEEIGINPDGFESSKTTKGFLAFGDLKMTPEDYNKLEVEAKKNIKNSVNTPANIKKADESAIKKMKELYEPVVKTVDNSYTVKVEFAK